MTKILTIALCLAMTACSTIRNDYTVNGQNLNEDHSTLKALGTIVLLAVVAKGVANANGCQHSYDRASDGSRCGGRSADSRPGGN